MTLRLAVLGDALLDRDVEGDVRRLAPDAPVPVVDHDRTVVRPGGAGLAAALAAADGHDVVLVTALADDSAGRELGALLQGLGVRVVDVGLGGATPEKIRVRAQGRALLRLDRGGDAGSVGGATLAAHAALTRADAVLVADYGRGVAAEPGLRAALEHAIAHGVPVVWDPHPRGPAPVAGVTLVTPNDAEARLFASAAETAGRQGAVARVSVAAADGPHGAVARASVAVAEAEGPQGAVARAELLRSMWGAAWVCVTRGADGAVAVGPDGPAVAVAAAHVPVGDPCGAGDRFASRAAELLGAGASVPDALRSAVAAASAFVAAGGAASAAGETGSAGCFAATEQTPAAAGRTDRRFTRNPRQATGGSGGGPARGVVPGRDDGATDVAAAAAVPARDAAAGRGGSAADVVAGVRASGGAVVATGGCFDLLHAGHVWTLQAARALGDCLVVCLNADASVRRLKGPRRPLVTEADRAAVLLALGCVDAVEVFPEDTPVAALERLRPDVWVKGGDYVAADLPEAPVLAAWGGRAVILPFVEGRSTTRLIEEAALHAV